MNIESELPEDFDRLSDEEKINELQKLRERLEGNSDSEVLKRRMVEELIESYR
ncbi:MAG: hypothetical protein ABEJ98_05725 [Candidatus Nanohaloarchaea archaeon]